jgi:hypothetical protein
MVRNIGVKETKLAAHMSRIRRLAVLSRRKAQLVALTAKVKAVELQIASDENLIGRASCTFRGPGEMEPVAVAESAVAEASREVVELAAAEAVLVALQTAVAEAECAAVAAAEMEAGGKVKVAVECVAMDVVALDNVERTAMKEHDASPRAEKVLALLAKYSHHTRARFCQDVDHQSIASRQQRRSAFVREVATFVFGAAVEVCQLAEQFDIEGTQSPC